MKKIVFVFLTFLANIAVYGQSEIVIAPNDNFTYDGEALHHYGVGFHYYDDVLNGLNLYGSGHFGIDFFTGGVHRFRITRNGNVGIGTTSPLQKLHISGGNFQLDLPVVYQQSKSFLIFGEGNDHVIQGQAWTGSDGSNVKSCIRFSQLGLMLQYPKSFSGFDVSTEFETGIFLSAGYHGSEKGFVGIGTTLPKAKLDVSGTIRATEIKVEAATTAQLNVDGTLHANTIKVAANGQTADFVFSDDYNLKELSEVEQFIKQNKHLPNIPSAAQMEASGVDLAEMNKLLLQKVEELTLYMIELKKENDYIKSVLNAKE